jgi:hypothetical protein
MCTPADDSLSDFPIPATMLLLNRNAMQIVETKGREIWEKIQDRSKGKNGVGD